MSEAENDELKEIIGQVTNEYNEYEHQREVCLSFREQFSISSEGIKVWSEPVIKLPDGKFKTPDLLLAQTEWLVLDYKEITSKKKKTLENHLIEMGEYNNTFTIGKTSFTPDVAMICSKAIAPNFKEIVNTIPVLGAKLGRTISLKLAAGKFKTKEIANIFLAEISFPLTTKASVQKFLRHDPKSDAYIAEIIWGALWQLNIRLGSDEIATTKKDLLEMMLANFPPYLKSHKGEDFDIQQVTETRANRGLGFLKDIDFIKISQEKKDEAIETVITSSRGKGRDIGDFKEFFIKKEAELRLEALQKERRKKEKDDQRRLERERKEQEKQARKYKGQQDLSKWMK